MEVERFGVSLVQTASTRNPESFKVRYAPASLLRSVLHELPPR